MVSKSAFPLYIILNLPLNHTFFFLFTSQHCLDISDFPDRITRCYLSAMHLHVRSGSLLRVIYLYIGNILLRSIHF